MGHENQVTRLQVNVFGQIFRGQHLLDVKNSRLDQIVRNVVKEHDLRVPAIIIEASGNGDRFGDGGVGAQLNFLG